MATKTKTKKQVSPASAFERIASAAESIRNGDPATLEVLSPGDVVRQGDVYLIALADKRPAEAGPYAGRQLAPGATQGSRHVAAGPCVLYSPEENSAGEVLGRLIPAARGQEHYFGPVIVAEGPVTIEHPEHGHRTLPAGVYLTTYQRAWAQEMRRQED